MDTSTSTYLTIGDHNFHYRVCGQGPDLLLLHGWISSGRIWDRLMADLAPYYRLWAIDLMGFGDSYTADPFRVLTVDDQARLVVVLCKALDLHPYAIIGHSMGGTIASKLGLEYPELADKLVLICPAVTGQVMFDLHLLLPTPAGRIACKIGQRLWPAVGYLPLPLLHRLAPWYLRPEAIRRSVQDFQRASWGAMYGGGTSLLNIGLDRRLPDLRKPTLIITGSKDGTVPPSDARLAAELIPGAQLLEIDMCHHLVPDEEPEKLLDAVYAFLRVDELQPVHA